MPSYPVRWFYDVLRGLDYFRGAGVRDARQADAVEVLRSKQLPDGRFRYENCHEGPTLFSMSGEGEGRPSRWVTLRALRVLRWWDGGRGAGALGGDLQTTDAPSRRVGRGRGIRVSS